MSTLHAVQVAKLCCGPFGFQVNCDSGLYDGVVCYAYTTLLKTNSVTAHMADKRLAVERDRITQTGVDGPNEGVSLLRAHINEDRFANTVHALPGPADWSIWSAEPVCTSTFQAPLAITYVPPLAQLGSPNERITVASVSAPPAQLIATSVAGVLFDMLPMQGLM